MVKRVPSRRENPIQAHLTRAAELDGRRQRQVQNQIDAINRLSGALVEGSKWTYDQEMAALHDQLAATQLERDELRARLAGAEGAIEDLKAANKLLGANDTGGMENDMGKKRDAFLAGFEQGTQPKAKRPDPDEAFDAYKASIEEDGDEDTADDE